MTGSFIFVSLRLDCRTLFRTNPDLRMEPDCQAVWTDDPGDEKAFFLLLPLAAPLFCFCESESRAKEFLAATFSTRIGIG